jgi:twitching motility two-component system response regulator PilG
MPISGMFVRKDRAATILFVDGDSSTRFAYHSVAVAAGFRVELARDGYEAIALANLTSPSIVVLDTLLTGFDGFEVIRQLRVSARTRSIPILVVSSQDGLEFDSAVRAAGCDGHLVKPCSADGLIRLVAILLIQRRAAHPGVAAASETEGHPRDESGNGNRAVGA